MLLQLSDNLVNPQLAKKLISIMTSSPSDLLMEELPIHKLEISHAPVRISAPNFKNLSFKRGC